MTVPRSLSAFRVLALLLITVVPPVQAQDDLKDLPDVATLEVQRRGDLVERVGVVRDDALRAYTAAMGPPTDDSHKWFVSLIVTDGCAPCEQLKRDLATSPALAPFVNPTDHTKSWAHYNLFRYEDATQTWRWKDIRLSGMPTLLVQPPRNGQFGDHRTVVWQRTGYDGNAAKLAQDLRAAIYAYVQRAKPAGAVTKPDEGTRARPTAGFRGEVKGVQQQTGEYEPPFLPPPKPTVPPTLPTLPTDWPPVTPSVPSTNTPDPTPSTVLGLVAQLLTSLLAGGGVQNLLLLALLALAGVRTFRKSTGQALLLDDDQFQALSDTLHALVAAKPSAKK